jgi:hypothetical protein
MAKKKYLTETEMLEQFRNSFENAKKQTEIATIMAEFGYTPEVIAEGELLLKTARSAYDANQKEGDETSKAYKDYAKVKENLEKIYLLDRKKAKVIFKNDPYAYDELELSGIVPNAHINFIELTRKFYNGLLNNPDLQAKVAKLKITPDGLNHALELLDQVNILRSEFLKELGESQLSRKTKDDSLAAIELWMRDFYAVAKIALDDKVKLMKALRN